MDLHINPAYKTIATYPAHATVPFFIIDLCHLLITLISIAEIHRYDVGSMKITCLANRNCGAATLGYCE